MTKVDHEHVETVLRNIVRQDPGMPLQVAAWHVRDYFDDWYAAYRGISISVHAGRYFGLEIRKHSSEIATLWPSVNGKRNPQPKPKRGRKPVEVDIAEAKRLKAAGWLWADIAATLRVGQSTLFKALREAGN